MIEILGLFAGRQKHSVMGDADRRQAVPQRCKVVSGNNLVGDDDDLTAAQQR